ncbi:MAG TPA: M13 family metallopeptidase [Gemmatimonadales bacterium]|nr:M13 family metallopeptidase [Gemmatimonadales bacterium]
MEMRSGFVAVLAVIGVACSHTAQPAQAPAPAVQAFDHSTLDTTCAPCRDFFQFANGGWLSHTEIPAAFPSWGSFNQLYEHNLDVLHDVLEAAARDDAAPPAPSPGGSNRRKLGTFYRTCMDSAAADAAGLEPLKPELDRIAGVSSGNALMAEAARLQRAGARALFSFTAGPDAKRSSEIIAEAGQGGLGLPDRDYYTKTDSTSERLRQQYVTHVARMLELAGTGADPARAAAQRIMTLETALAVASMTRVQQRDPNAVYHKMTVAELGAISPSIAWEAYFAEVGALGVVGAGGALNVRQPDFFKAMSGLVRDRPMDDWRWYLRWHLVDRFGPWLASPLASEAFHFEQTLTGVKEQQPRWRRCVQATDNALGEALGQEYVARAFSPAAKRRALEMVHNLESVMEDRLHRLSWMGDTTRQQALIKLAGYTNKIGYPDRWTDYRLLRIDPGSFVANVQRAAEFDTGRRLAEIGKPVDRTRFGMTPPTVNAYYNARMNEIVFPAGILQPPFFNPDADDAINYGGMGAVIGHELTHGFDDAGRQYDAVGNLRDWWTPADGDRFKAQAQLVVDQFGGYVAVDTLRVNGRLTLGENLADLNGLRIAYAALERTLVGKPRPPLIDGFTPEQRFFLGWAQVWRGKNRDEYARLLVNVDPHSPPRWRVNGPLSNMTEFRQAFACTAGDTMVRPDSVQPHIW